MRKSYLILMLSMMAQNTDAQNVHKLEIHSKADSYELILSGNSATVGGKTVDLGKLKDLQPVLTDPLTSPCTIMPKGAPDVTIREGSQTRSIYFKSGVVSDGTNCLSVGGDGLYYFPVHREFIIGTKNDGIELKSPLKMSRGEEEVFILKKAGSGPWTAEKNKLLLNWDFIERLVNSLSSFEIRFRVLPDLAHDKTHLQLKSGGQTFTFYKISTNTWALKKPGAKWLEASDTWSFWYDFDDAVLEDRLAPAIRAAGDKGQTQAARQAAFDKLSGTWSPNLRELYLKILADPTDNDFKALALRRLRSKPSIETARGLAPLLGGLPDDDLKKSASQILKIFYPKGPLYNAKDPAEKKQQVIDYWSNWWSKNKGEP